MKKEFPDKRTIIIFTGGPGTGKSGTAKRFLDYLGDGRIEKISYDEIKEKNWDRFGFDNNRQKARLNAWGLEEFYLTIQKSMWENKTILIEYPFYQRHKPKLKELINESHYSAATVFLYTDMQTVYRRGISRDQSSDRHPGHLLESYHIETYEPKMLNSVLRVALSYEEFTVGMAEKDYDISLGLRIPVDVTDFSTVNYQDIYHRIVEYELVRQKVEGD